MDDVNNTPMTDDAATPTTSEPVATPAPDMGTPAEMPTTPAMETPASEPASAPMEPTPTTEAPTPDDTQTPAL